MIRKFITLNPNKAYERYLDFGTLPDGILPKFSGPTWRVVSGYAQNDVTLSGSELFSNGDMETGNPPTGWASKHTATLAADADVPEGGGSQSILITNGAASDGSATQNEAITTGIWYYVTAFGKAGTTVPGLVFRETAVLNMVWSSGDWSQLYVSFRALTTATGNVELLNGSSTLGRTSYFDNASIKVISPTTMFSVQKYGSAYGVVKASWTKGTFTQCPMGVVMCANSTFNNFVIAYLINPTGTATVRMDKCVNGTYINLVSVGTPYAANTEVSIRRAPGTNTFQVFYNNTQVGADQTIADASIINNTLHGLFDSSPLQNRCTRFLFSASMVSKTITGLGDSIMFNSTTWLLAVRDFYRTGTNTLNNRAVAGHSIMANMDADVVAAAGDNADIIIINLGVNDNNAGDMNALQAEVEENIAELKVSNPNATIYYMNLLPYWTDPGGAVENDKANIRAAIAAACTAQSITCWDTYTVPWITAADTSDGLHPNDSGNNKIVIEVLKRLAR